MPDSRDPIYVTRTFMPPQAEYEALLSRIFSSAMVTNQGPLLKELEAKLRDVLQVPYFQLLANGTLALQLALRALGIMKGEIITTPFSYVATTSAILYEGCTPVFADIEPKHFCIAPNKVEAAITADTRAILATHVFGYPCDVERLEAIGKKHRIPVIYDGAHAFGCRYQGKSLLSYGDAATCSFHATKVFHTVEGGGVVLHEHAAAEKLELLKRFGHNGDVHYHLGINAKMSEFHAAMGLCNLKYLAENMEKRRKVSSLYDALLPETLHHPGLPAGLEYNYAYYPVLFPSEEALKAAFARLAEENIFPRRYFYPSLDRLPYLEQRTACPVSNDIASRIACLPLHDGLPEQDVKRIADILNSTEKS